jgi:Zn-dependent peptidase ImmA (M78 family)
MLEGSILRAPARRSPRGRSRRAHGPPFDPYPVAAELDVTVTETEISGALGYVQRSEDRYEVFLSAALSLERKRFTLGHELGHVILMRAACKGLPVNLVRYRKTGCPPGIAEDPAEEALCNRFGEEVLMPEWHVTEVLRDQEDYPGAVREIRKLFRVSLHAAATRLMTLKGTRPTSSISLWDCSTPWPTTQWWVGRRLESRSERDAIEALVQAVDGDRGSIEVLNRTPSRDYRWKRASKYDNGRSRIRMDVRLVRDGRWMLVSMREASAPIAESYATTAVRPVSSEAMPPRATRSPLRGLELARHQQLAMSFDE